MADIQELRNSLTDEFLRNRPSFKRFKARAAKLGHESVDRYDYDALMRDIRQLKSLFRAAQVDPDTVTVDKMVFNSWGKSGDDYFQVKAYTRPKLSPEAVELAPEPRPLVYNTTARRAGGMDTINVPDLHIGWLRTPEGEMLPLHDEQYLEALLGVIRYFRPARVVCHGDNLDLAAFSTFKNDPGYLQTIRQTVKTGYEYHARMREAAGADCEILYLEGNHEARIRKRLQDVLPEAAALAIAGDDVSVFSPRHFLRLDELGIQYIAPYGARVYREGIMYLHGEVIGSEGGDTTSKMIKKYGGRTAQGHTHRLGLNYHTEWTEHGEVEGWAMEVGYGGRMDGVVPGGMYQNWKRGFGCTWAGTTPVPAVYPWRHETGEFIIEGTSITSALDQGASGT